MASLPGHIFGLTLSNKFADANNDVDVSPGACCDQGGAQDIVLAAALTKRLDAAWAVGAGEGGLDTGSKAADTAYHVWLIRRSDNGVVDALFSTSATSPVLPANYDQRRRIGCIVTDGSGNILPFHQVGDQFRFKGNFPTPYFQTPMTGNATPTIATLSRVPLGVKVEMEFQAHTNAGSGQGWCAVTDPDLGTPAYPQSPWGELRADVSNGVGSRGMRCWTNASAQICVWVQATCQLTMWIRGWRDLRDAV